MHNSKHLLSVVIITKNEERNIEKCLKSVIEAVRGIDSSEIILVDSASIDKTVRIAKKYPIKILQLHSSWKLSPSAGRYIGSINSSGKYIQFLDGDMILDKKWPMNAISFLEKSDDNVAGVSGSITQSHTKSLMLKKFEKEVLEKTKVDKAEEVRGFLGAFMLKASILKKVGQFDPYLNANEEGELCDRIFVRGYKLIMLPFHTAHHNIAPNYEFINELKKKINFTIAEGQVFRRSLFNKGVFFWRFLHHKFYFFGILFTLSGLIISLMYPKLMYLWLFAISIISLWILTEEKNFKYAIIRFILSFILWPFFIKGFLEQPKDPRNYPKDVKIIK